MKTTLRALVVLFLCAPAFGQTAAPGPGGAFTFGTIAGVGQVGPQLSFSSMPSAPGTFNISWANHASAATTCTLRVEGSNNGTDWYDLSGTKDCTVQPPLGGAVIQLSPYPLIRVNVLSFAGPTDAAIQVTYGRGN